MDLASILYRALESPYGIEVLTSNPTALRAKLYPARKESPAFSCLAFIIPPTNPEGSLWIVKKPE